MSKHFSSVMFSIVAAAFLPGHASAQEVGAEERDAARLFASIEAPLAARNQPLYCDSFIGGADFKAYATRACQHGVKVGVRKPEQCTAEVISKEVQADLKECHAMDAAAFSDRIAKHGEARSRFVQEMGKRGVDGEKLIAEERGKLK
jgi:hypothetical protein